MERSGIRPDAVAGLCLDGQMAGIAAVDREGRAAMPYDSWLDIRCTPYVERMRSRAQEICARTGAPPTYSHGPKILWWMHERPETFAQICKFVMPAGYVTMRLCGMRGEEAFVDPTYLHFSCLSDTERGQWSEALCAHFGVPQDRLPRIVEPWEVVGRLSREAAEAMGLRSGTPVAAGAGDQAAAMLGAGVLEPGMAYDAAGTASVLALCVDRFAPDVHTGTLLCARMVPQGRWYLIGYIGGGGLNLRWWRDLLRQITGTDRWDYPELDAAARSVPPGCQGLLFIPHLAGRVCPNQPELRGAWLGVAWTHGPEHLYRAMLESVAYEYAIYLEIARERSGVGPLREVRVVGGGARSDLWNQIKCDVLGVPYARLNRTEAAALGSALLAGFAVGVFREAGGGGPVHLARPALHARLGEPRALPHRRHRVPDRGGGPGLLDEAHGNGCREAHHRSKTSGFRHRLRVEPRRVGHHHLQVRGSLEVNGVHPHSHPGDHAETGSTFLEGAPADAIHARDDAVHLAQEIRELFLLQGPIPRTAGELDPGLFQLPDGLRRGFQEGTGGHEDAPRTHVEPPWGAFRLSPA
jgi:xylulokinase